MSRELCICERGWYETENHSSCYECFLDRRADYVDCILCGVRWHSPEYATCFQCRGHRDEAARDLRLLILHRDGYQCRQCGESTGLQVDHLRPCAKGGTADPWNLQVLCGPCNRDKGSTWWSGCSWDQIRHEQVTAYFISGRDVLDVGQQERLRTEVAQWRHTYGFNRPVAWLTDWRDRADELFDQMETMMEDGSYDDRDRT